MLALLALVVVGCSTAGGGTGDHQLTVRIGYFPNLTHAPAIVGMEMGYFADALGASVVIEPHTFNAGGEVVEAIASGALDMSYVGPNPAITAFARSHGEAIRIIAGATAGGASLVVRDGINGADDLQGTRLASPALGNTQDVALRTWLDDQGYETTLEGGGDVTVVPQDNAQTLDAFRTGQVDGAWVPEPWATRMVEEGGHVLVDERELWPEGRFVTTQLIVATDFLEEHPEVVRAVLEGHVQAIGYLNQEPEAAQKVVSAAIIEITGSQLPPGTMAAAWKNLEFTADPIAASLVQSAQHAADLGLLEDPDLEGIYDLELLNEVLADAGQQPVPQP